MTESAAPRDPADIIRWYVEHNFQLVFWPATGDAKGPHEQGWQVKPSARLEDWRDGLRSGIKSGTEVEPNRYLHDVDIDWTPGAAIALAFIPATEFVYGRAGKRISHCFYTLTEPLPTMRFEDVDRTCLIELRGTKSDGGIGLQSMVPPSTWTKDGRREPLEFVKFGKPSHHEAELLKQRVTLAAIGMLLAKRFGRHGFGHEVRLAWAGFLLRAGIAKDDLISMGVEISHYCHNTEIHDVRTVVESTIINISKEGKKVRGSKALASILGEQGKAIVGRINEWLGREGDFIRDQHGRILARNHHNVKRAIEQLGRELTYNEFAEQMLIDGRPMEDPQWKALIIDIELEFHFQPPPDYFRMVIEDAAHRNRFHPVKDYLDSLTWDREPRLDAWIITAARAEDTPYVRAVSSIMLIAAARRIKSPGAKYDELVIWESKQGTNKSSAAQALCPNPDWFSDDLKLNVQSKELIEATLGKWIVEASELSGKRKAEIEQLKAMLSRRVDGPARMAYAHFAVQRPRHFIVVGTTNSSVYLTDPTGGRRFWPIKVQRFDVDWIVRNRDQLWAEAAYREAQGESIRLREDLWPHADVEQEKRRELDPWESVIRDALLKESPHADDRRRISTNALWGALSIPIERRDRTGSLRITDIMQRFGFVRTRIRPRGEDVQVGFVQDDLTKLELPEGDDVPSREPGEDDGDPGNGLGF